MLGIIKTFISVNRCLCKGAGAADFLPIKIGQRVFISAAVLGSQPLTGRVTKIYPRAEEKMSTLGVAQHRVPIIIEVYDQKNLKPGDTIIRDANLEIKPKTRVKELPK